MTTADGPILVATDFSAHACHAADRAARLAHETAAPLTLLHVLPGETLAQLRAWLGAASAPEAQLRSEAQQRLQQLADELAAARQVEVSCRDAAGPVLDEIRARPRRSTRGCSCSARAAPASCAGWCWEPRPNG